MSDTTFLNKLRRMLRDRDMDMIFTCIHDLIVNGLCLDRFSDSESHPDRQDITQYLAAWSRYVGFSEDACREWLPEYCVAMLSSISRTSASGIRHSTKSNIKYIYRSRVAFDCRRENNRFKAHCTDECPVYTGVEVAATDFEGQDLDADRNASPAGVSRSSSASDSGSQDPGANRDSDPADRSTKPVTPVKALYREQFETALKLVRCEVEKGTKRKSILNLLDQKGLKTRTGRKWTLSILVAEIGKIQSNPESECEVSGSEE